MLKATWIFFLGTKSNPTEIFVYGLSLPTHDTVEGSTKKDIGKIGDKRLFLFRAVKDAPDFTMSDDLDLSQLCNNIKNTRKITPIYKQNFIQNYEMCSLDEMVESPINSVTRITSFYTTEIQSAKLDNDTLISLLKLLEENLNQKFYGKYAKRLGCFEVGQVLPWAESNVPFVMKRDQDNGKYIFHKNIDFNENLSLVLSIYQSKDEKIFEKLISIPKEQNDFIIDIPGLINHSSHWGYRYSVYSESGDLLHQDLCIYIGEINFMLNTTGNSSNIKIDDAFSRRDKSLEIIPHRSNTMRSVIPNPYESKTYTSLRHYYSNLLELIKDDKTSPTEGRWFKKSDSMLSEIIKYINSLLYNAKNAVIIDPYTDGDMMSLIIRMNVPQIKIIGSNQSFPKNMLEYYTNKILDFKNILKANNSEDNSRFFFVSRKFHDRFILIEHHDNFQIYCLPNSINAMLKNNDFLILKLNGKVKQQAAEHINALLKDCTDDCEIRI